MNNRQKDSGKRRVKQGAETVTVEPYKIGASTPFDFKSKNLTAYGGLLPVTTMLEKLGFQGLVEETVTVKRVTRSMPACQFIATMVLAVYVGFSRLNHMLFPGTGADAADRDTEGGPAPATVGFLAVSGVVAPDGGAATGEVAAAVARAGMGSGARETEDGDGG